MIKIFLILLSYLIGFLSLISFIFYWKPVLGIEGYVFFVISIFLSFIGIIYTLIIRKVCFQNHLIIAWIIAFLLNLIINLLDLLIIGLLIFILVCLGRALAPFA